MGAKAPLLQNKKENDMSELIIKPNLKNTLLDDEHQVIVSIPRRVYDNFKEIFELESYQETMQFDCDGHCIEADDQQAVSDFYRAVFDFRKPLKRYELRPVIEVRAFNERQAQDVFFDMFESYTEGYDFETRFLGLNCIETE